MILNYLIFLGFVIIVIYPIGKISLDLLNLKINFWAKSLLSINIGLVILTLFIYFCRFIGINFFYWLILIPFVFIFFKFIKNINKTNIKFSINTKNFIFLLFLCISVLIQLITIFPSGFSSNGQLILAGVHNHDSTWHLALIQEIVKNIPPENPIYFGYFVENYHYLFDVFVSIIFMITGIPLTVLYFKIISSFLLLIFSCTVFLLLVNLKLSKIIQYFGLLFIPLTSNLYYLSILFFPDANTNPSVFWVQEYLTKIVNPQLLLSYIIIITLLILLISYKKYSLKFIFLFSLLTTSLLGFKIYGYILFMIALFLVGILSIFKKDIKLMTLLIASALFSVFYYLLFNIKYQQLLIFNPFWFIKTMFESQDHLNNPVWELKRQTYLEHNNYLRIAQLYFEGCLFFIFGNLGGRVLGFLSISNTKDHQEKNAINMLFIISILGILLPLFFIQKGTSWNTIQFFYYSVFSLSILTIVFLDELLKTKRKILTYFLILILFISLLPGVYQTTIDYLGANKNSVISVDITESLKYLKDESDGIVLISPDFYSSSLISAISNKAAFFADETQLAALSIPYNFRKTEVDNFFSGSSLEEKKEFLENNKIGYIFTVNKKNDFFDKMNNIHRLYTNDEVIIYRYEN